MISPSKLRCLFLFVFIHDTEYSAQGEVCLFQTPNLNSEICLLTQLTAMIFQSNAYLQSFDLLRDLALSEVARNKSQVVIRSDRRSKNEIVR